MSMRWMKQRTASPNAFGSMSAGFVAVARLSLFTWPTTLASASSGPTLLRISGLSSVSSRMSWIDLLSSPVATFGPPSLYFL